MKPHIQKLFDAFSKYGIACARANYNAKAFKEAQAEFKKDLEELGIAGMFDWGTND